MQACHSHAQHWALVSRFFFCLAQPLDQFLGCCLRWLQAFKPGALPCVCMDHEAVQAPAQLGWWGCRIEALQGQAQALFAVVQLVGLVVRALEQQLGRNVCQLG